jgi:hypothetical protein
MEVAASILPAQDLPARTVVTAVRGNGSLAMLAATPERSPADPTAAVAPALAVDRECLPVGTSVPIRGSGPRPFEPASRAEVQPLTAERSRIHVTVDRSFHARLEEARDALSHAHPRASDGDILELALEALLAQAAKRRGIGTRRLKTPRPSRREHVPDHVVAAALERAGHCCEWKLAAGGVCGSRRRLQPDHIQPLALGGTSDLSNIRILCAFHNLLAAREVFGDEWMDQFTANPRAAGARRAIRREMIGAPPTML